MANLSFSKVTTVGSTGLITGRIYFETSTGCIKVAKSATAVDVFGAGVKSASWDEGSQTLTIVNQNNEQIEVDFSDIASASSVTSKLAAKLNIGSSSDASSVQSYYGLKKYVDEQIEDIPAGVTSFGGQTGAITVDTDAATNGAVKFAMTGKELGATVVGLGSAAYTASTAYATVAQGTKADSALQTVVGAPTSGGPLTITAGSKSNGSITITGKLATGAVTTNNSTTVPTTAQVKTYVDSQVNAAVSSALKYKGSCTYAELPEEPVTGDVWNVTDTHDNVPAGTNYAWNGESWDALAGSVDLSSYLTETEASSTYITPSAVDTKITAAINALDKVDSAAANQFVTAVSEANGVITVTRAQPTIANINGLQDALNGKANTSHTHTGAQVTLTGYTKPSSGDTITAKDSVNTAIGKLEASLGSKVDTNTTYTFASGTDGSFTVTPSTGGAVKVTIGKPATAGTADNATTANKVAQSLVVRLNGGTTEGTSQFTFNGSTAKTVNITAALVGAAASTHTHQYAGSASAGGPANSVANALTIQLNGSAQPTYNGAAARTINITPSSIGAYTKAEVDAKWVWAEFE